MRCCLADFANGRAEPDLVVTSARLLSTYSERVLADRELWIAWRAYRDGQARWQLHEGN